jgi:hypothetical protein
MQTISNVSDKDIAIRDRLLQFGKANMVIIQGVAYMLWSLEKTLPNALMTFLWFFCVPITNPSAQILPLLSPMHL